MCHETAPDKSKQKHGRQYYRIMPHLTTSVFSLGIFNLSESFNASMAMLESLRVVRPAIANSALM
jgi:hypothetical protein